MRLRPALICYSVGLLATILAFVTAYLTQLRLFREERDLQTGSAVRQRHSILLWLGITLVLLATVAFGAGCWEAAGALTSAPG